MDEKSGGKGHNYVTIVYDGDDGSVIDCTEGRKGEDSNTLCANAFTEEEGMLQQSNSERPFCSSMKSWTCK